MMSKLELKILPLVLVLIFMFPMWWMAVLFPSNTSQNNMTVILALMLFAIGVVFVIAGGISFKAKKTTVNPTKPHTSSSLVTSGVYAYTRNPMYVGFVCLLIAWGFYLNNFYSMTFIIGFVFYMNRFQIKPEEQALTMIFGEEYLAYKDDVRRWL